MYNHIQSGFPELVKDIEKHAASTQEELELLSPPHQTTADQRRFLTRLANAYQHKILNALSSNYDAQLDGKSSIKLRMRVSRLNNRFAKCKARSGHAKILQDMRRGINKLYARTSGDREDT